MTNAGRIPDDVPETMQQFGCISVRAGQRRLNLSRYQMMNLAGLGRVRMVEMPDGRTVLDRLSVELEYQRRARQAEGAA